MKVGIIPLTFIW